VIFNDINLKELFELMQQYDVSETILKDQEREVVVKRGSNRVKESFSVPISALSSLEDKLSSATTSHMENVSNKEETPAVEKYHSVRAPLVGTFYRSPSPDAAPFVEVGDRIAQGETLCIVEAMKSMNEIPSDVSGVVKEICVGNAEMVEFDQPLFKIDTAG